MAAPKGNNNAGRGRQATHALELLIKHIDEWGEEEPDWSKVEVASGMKPLMKMWYPQAKAAMHDGNLGALTAIVDRLDGRPRQAVDVGGQDDNPLITQVKRTIVKP